MDRTKWPAVGGSVAGIVLLTRSIPTTFAFDKPFHTAISCLATTAVTLLVASRLLPRSNGSNGRQYGAHEYAALPLEERGVPHASRDTSPNPVEDAGHPLNLRTLRILFLMLVTSLCLRVVVWAQVIANIQCAKTSWTPILPLAIAVLDYWMVQRRRSNPTHEDDPDASIYDAIDYSVAKSPYRYILATSLVGLGGMLATSSNSDPRSTYICAAGSWFRWTVPLQQWTGAVLDLTILFCVGRLLYAREAIGARSPAARFASVGWAFLFSSIGLLLTGIVYFLASPDDRYWILAMPDLYFWSTLKFNLLCSLTTVCLSLLVFHLGVMTASLLVTFASVASVTTTYAWSNPHPFPPGSTGLGLLAIAVMVLGFALYFHVEKVSERGLSTSNHSITFHRIPSWFSLCLLSLFCLRAGLWATQTNAVSYHPIDMLIYEAQAAHEFHRNQSAISHALPDAVRRYREKYNRHPPPGFQHWYRYATERGSIVIDEFDGIYNDLLPFYALSPGEIRLRTWKVTSNPWHFAGAIIIRDGEASIGPNVVPTHVWMLDGVMEILDNFVRWLPDMDLAFNLNDECRIAVPFETVEQMREQGRRSDVNLKSSQHDFSKNRGEQWRPIPDESNDAERVLHELSLEKTFYDFSSIGCSPASPARTRRKWDVSALCTECTAPHSLGGFLGNWTLAADVCHQPDLADLHGLYLSPAAFRGSSELYPIFSQSKAAGFNDILYPSAWNYMEKAHYAPSDSRPDMPFELKNDTLFWRGATSEGVSAGAGQWKGMARQRFVHLANNVNASAAPRSLLVPAPRPNAKHRLTYESVPSSQLTELFSVDINVVDSIVRCGGRDCPDQAAEFAPMASHSDFQDHWRYKYLLDLDGAGFSGRFLPFLRSGSLPFKAALFREWWDDRVTPWQHFVPLDLRGHAFWATLMYFTGLNGQLNGRDVQVEGHGVEAQRIAQRGQKWANLVLRKEDMEIYFFRLLLEWGRLTDDRRDDLGYGE